MIALHKATKWLVEYEQRLLFLKDRVAIDDKGQAFIRVCPEVMRALDANSGFQFNQDSKTLLCCDDCGNQKDDDGTCSDCSAKENQKEGFPNGIK